MKIIRFLAILGSLCVIAIGVYACFISDIENATSVGFLLIFVGLILFVSQIFND